MAKGISTLESACTDAARVMRAASAQIDLALEESHPSVERLGETLQRLAALLARSGAVPEAERESLRGDLATAITCLQFHDRMTQHLTHVRAYLQDSAAEMAAHATGADPVWDHLHRGLSARLLTDAHRDRLGEGFPEGYFGAGAEARGAPSAPSRGDVELF